MVSSAAVTTSNKYLQLAIAVILIGLSAKNLSNRSSLGSTADALSAFNVANNGTSLDLDNSWKINAAAVSAATFSFISSLFNYIFPSVIFKYFMPKTDLMDFNIGYTTKKYIEIPFETLSHSFFSVSKAHTSYVSSLLSSETISHAFWFVNMIVQVSDFASYKCGSVDSLLDTYNVTGISGTDITKKFFNIFDNSSSTTSIYNDLYQSLLNSNLTQISNLTDVSIGNLNGTQLQTNLLLALSQDCQIKKSSMAMTIIYWVSHVLSSGMLVSEMTSFYNKFLSIKISAENLSHKNETTTRQAEEQDAEEEATEEGEDNSVDENEKETNDSFRQKVYLVFDHHWGLFNVIMKKKPTAEA